MRLTLGIFVIGLFALPGGLILLGMRRMKEKRRSGWWTTIGLGGLVLWVASLDVLGTVAVSFLLNAEALARFAIYSAYLGDAASYLGLLAVGVGMIRFAADTHSEHVAHATPTDSV